MKALILSVAFLSLTVSIAKADGIDKSDRAKSASLAKICRGLQSSIEEAMQLSTQHALESEDGRSSGFAKLAGELTDRYEALQCHQRLATERSNRAEDVKRCQALRAELESIDDQLDREAIGAFRSQPEPGLLERLHAKRASLAQKSRALVCRQVLK